MLSGFLSATMIFKTEKEASIRMHFFLLYCNTAAAEAFSDFATTMQLQWYNHSYVIMGRHTIRLLAE